MGLLPDKEKDAEERAAALLLRAYDAKQEECHCVPGLRSPIVPCCLPCNICGQQKIRFGAFAKHSARCAAKQLLPTTTPTKNPAPA